MCKVLKIPKSSYYYAINNINNKLEINIKLEQAIITIFDSNRKVYGTRRIKAVLLENYNLIVSRRQISRIMHKHDLVSKYTKAYYKKYKGPVNESSKENILNRKFQQNKRLSVLVSDLSYVRVNGKWSYICLFTDLYNREIVGYSWGNEKTSELVLKALGSIKGDLRTVTILHTDRGKEFDNRLLDNALETFGIKRSLSAKGCPYDNSVAEANFKTIKVELIIGEKYDTLEDLSLDLFDYVNWYNNTRIHSTLNYTSPVLFAKQHNVS